MKTFDSFLLEATEKDIKRMGGNDEQIALLKKRQARRGYGFGSNDERTDAPEKEQEDRGGALAIRKKDSMKKSSSALAKNKSFNPQSKTPSNGSSGIVKYGKSKEDEKAAAKQKLASDSAGEPKPNRTSEDKKREEDQRKKKNGKGLDLGRGAGWLKDKVTGAAKGLVADPNKPVDTYHATPIA